MTKNRSMDKRPCAATVAAVLLLAGCATSTNHAPVEDRSGSARVPNPSTVIVVPPLDPALKEPPKGIENAGRNGYYTVKQGDTLIRVGLETGQNWKDLVKWNNLDNPNLIEVGQVIRVLPPETEATAPGPKPVTAAKVETKPLSAGTAASGVTTIPVAGASSAPPSPVVAAAPASASRDVEDNINWMWPANGPVTISFDEVRSKGLAITGKAGDPVLAAADGRVVYAGSGLRGYGNLVILKHNNTYLTAYAHNQALLVKEDQSVKRGQRIAEMGSSDADGVQLHFEIRKLGKPIDPAKLLPPRP